MPSRPVWETKSVYHLIETARNTRFTNTVSPLSESRGMYMFRGRRNTAVTRDAQAEKFSIWESSRGGGWGSNSLSFSHAESRNSHFTGGFARRFFAAIAATLLVVGVIAGSVAGIGVGAASAATPLSVTTTSPLPLAPLNTPYSTTLAATGGTGSYTWSVASGSTLPSWLSLNSSTGVLSGTPTTNATATFAVTVTDSPAQLIRRPRGSSRSMPATVAPSRSRST